MAQGSSSANTKVKIDMAQGSSSSKTEVKIGNVVQCICKCPAKILKSWTDANPGRRFYSCGRRGRRVGNKYESCNFFRWFDEEKPHGWQYYALLEARGIIQEQKEEIRKLRETSRELGMENSSQIVQEFLSKFEIKE